MVLVLWRKDGYPGVAGCKFVAGWDGCAGVSISSKHRATAPRTLCVSRRRSISPSNPKRRAVPAGRSPSACLLDGGQGTRLRSLP